MKKAILPAILALVSLASGLGWYSTEQAARLDFEDYNAEIDSLQDLVTLKTQELATCERKLAAKQTGLRFNSVTKQYERLEWVARDFFELGLDKTKLTIPIYPAH